jgi:hypothetical protein
MNILKFNKISLAALLGASMALVMLPGCSSTEETPATDDGGGEECLGGGPRGAEGICCDVDPIQPGCPGQ